VIFRWRVGALARSARLLDVPTEGLRAVGESVSSLGRGRKLSVLLVPWAFVIAFAAVYVLVLLPRVREGHLAALCLGAFVALVFVSFLIAAIMFSHDVLAGRWP
jgi:hypothetical protein